MTRTTPEIAASPTTRKRALEKGLDIEALARDLARTTIGPEDIDAAESTTGGAAPAGAAAQAAPTGHTAFWEVDHAQYGPVTEEPLSRFAKVAARNLAAAQALIPAVTHHDMAETAAIEALRAGWKD